jgi:steroid delta-isomerase-like uncharacterized protein
MSEENKRLVLREVEEVFSQGRLDAYDEILAPNYVFHDPTLPEPVRGIQAAKEFAGMYVSAFPGMSVEADEVLAEGDGVAVRWTARGTHTGALGDIPPSGRDVTVSGSSFYRIESGKIAEDWSVYDALGLMQQIGAVSESARAVN